jgi:hypothetical protein
MSPSRNDSATESVERVRVLCLHFECHALVGLKSVDFICPQERAFVPEEDRPRQLSVTSLALFALNTKAARLGATTASTSFDSILLSCTTVESIWLRPTANVSTSG